MVNIWNNHNAYFLCHVTSLTDDNIYSYIICPQDSTGKNPKTVNIVVIYPQRYLWVRML